jgi:hypothetical protein
MLVHKTIHQV